MTQAIDATEELTGDLGIDIDVALMDLHWYYG